MFTYYLGLAIRSLRRNLVLTMLMIAAIGLGIGASMTVVTMFRAMSGNPIPWKSSQLFVPQIDNWGPKAHEHDNEPEEQLSYTDADALLRAHLAKRQAAMYAVGFVVIPADSGLQSFSVDGRATGADFFPMFDVPFLFGSGWSADDDDARTPVAVISRKMNDKLFGGANSVGKTLNLDHHDYRVVGVIDRWSPVPRFYDLNGGDFDESEDIFIPFSRAIDQQMQGHGNNSCHNTTPSGWEGHLHWECVWIQFWAELPTAADAMRYRTFLDQYAAGQQQAGRFSWPANTRLRDVAQWLDYRHVVSNEAHILLIVSFSFLVVCLVNAVGLMLARFMARAGEIGVRRALGAQRRAIFAQCLVETGLVGLIGGLLGLGLTLAGLAGLRQLLSEEALRLTRLDTADVLIAIGLAIVAALLAGLYPTWRATRVQAAWQLKAN